VNLYRVLPADSSVFSFESEQDRELLATELAPPPGPFVRALMVTASNGTTIGVDGTSRSLTRGVDRKMLRLFRETSDAIVVGMATIRAESVPVPDYAPLVVLSGSGDFTGHKLLMKPGSQLLVVTSEAGAKLATETLSNSAHQTLILPGTGPWKAEQVRDALLAERNAQHLLIEGGRTIWETFAGITDEVCLSVVPPPTNTQAGIPSWWPGDTTSWNLVSLMSDDEKMLYYRYRTTSAGVPLGKL